ncbi:putative ORFan [Tupanvirus deep ocean]|uniref:ORFan n=2 Tax=Tupanvirus TaxID=2094720 RepID=A0AC62A9Y4_9VIRU|nr:putative ORFan [Tupanvirus deep ocean]QKU34488.1 putative ORFan [Tupanvirus deep ocean]
MSITNSTKTNLVNSVNPINPPFKTLDQYIKAHTPDFLFSNLVAFHARRKELEKHWINSGIITQWHTKETTDNNNQICLINKALVRGDGKILSKIDQQYIPCDSCKHFAENVNGYLRGIEASGKYIYA